MRKTAFFLAILTFSLPSLAEPTSYVRFDQDYLFGSQIWAGGTIPFNDRFALALTAFIPENYPSYATGTNSWWENSMPVQQSPWARSRSPPWLVSPSIGHPRSQ